MRIDHRRLLALLVLILLIGALLPAAFAADRELYTNPETGFRVYILDEDDLLSSSEESRLLEEMKPITQYGHAIFWSTRESTHGDEIEQARLKRRAVTGMDSAGIFVINMSARKITFQSYGRIYEVITRSYARTITNNVSRYATDGDYYSCAANGFRQAFRLLEGERIAQPMKIVSYALIALMLGLLAAVLFVFGKRQNTVYKKLALPLSAAVTTGVLLRTDPTSRKSGQNRRYSPPSSDSSSGGGGGCGGGGGGCGGGGSSSF